MTLNTYFRASSYAMIACGALALVLSGGLSVVLACLFAVLMLVAWQLERTRWQLSERVGLLVVLLALPLFYLDWKYGAANSSEGFARVGVSALGHLIISLSAVKLFQVKADRDWLFLYLISFFEVLLAAGLSVSPLFFFALCLYILCALSTIIAFEIRSARRAVKIKETRFLAAPNSSLLDRILKLHRAFPKSSEARQLPLVSATLVALILAFALPIFFIAPRFGANAFTRADSSRVNNFIGFSNSVTLGDIGEMQQNDQTVMRVRVEDNTLAERNRSLRWRGIALDYFTGRKWKKTNSKPQSLQKNERGLFQFDTVESTHDVTTQTFFVEPLDQPVLFAAPQAVALQIAAPYIYRDAENALYTRAHNTERISYTVYSDTVEPAVDSLRADDLTYTREFTRYLQLPDALDPRVRKLAQGIVAQAGARNAYDQARAIEEYLNRGQAYRYTLQLKAGGEDPLADFLFNVREGHCEYFATSMAIMLRTLGIATRIVNGFQMGEYNDAADVYTIKQRDAHSWVEAYFPATHSWVTFDPTPAAGRPVRVSAAGLTGRINKYAEALEFVWMQYVVSYDQQEQRSLANSLRNHMVAYRRTLAGRALVLKEIISSWLPVLGSDDKSSSNAGRAFKLGLLLFLILVVVASSAVLYKREDWRASLWRKLGFRQRVEKERHSAVVFYNRMIKALAARGLHRATSETPLEFAANLKMPEALTATRAYNRVRFGEQKLLPTEIAQIENWLKRLEEDALNVKR